MGAGRHGTYPRLGSRGATPAGCLDPGALVLPGDGERSLEVGPGAQTELWTPACPPVAVGHSSSMA